VVKVVKLQNVCVHALGDKPARFRMPEDMEVSEITYTYKSGGVTCATMASGMTKYGCGENYLGLVITKQDKKVIMPLASQQIPGFQRTMHHHAHWYTIQGISNKSAKLSWKFGRKPMMAEGDYQIWYNEDLTNGTVADNAGVACYDMEIVEVVKVVKLQNVCVHALGDKPAPFRVPEDMKVKNITFTHKSGGVTCSALASGMTKYGCGENSLGLVITKQDNLKVIMPLATQQIPGFQRTTHHHAHWYTIQGISNKSPKLSWKFGRKPMMAEGDYQIWYNEDLTNGTVADNAGVACYDVEIVGV